MAKRGRKPLMRVEGTCESARSYHSNSGKFDMTITRDGMAGYGYCTEGHWNIKFLKPADELMYLYLTKHRLTGGGLTGIETKLLFESFRRWCKIKKIDFNETYRRGGSISITLAPKIEFSMDSQLFPDMVQSWAYTQRLFNDPAMIQDCQRISSAHSQLFESRQLEVTNIETLINAVQQIKDYLGMESVNKDEIIKDFNMRILRHNEKVLEKMRKYAKEHYGVE